MPINVKGLFETLQYKANNIDSSTSTAEILDTLKAIQRTDGNTIISYDSDGALPDAATTNIKLAYVKNTGIVKFNNGIWDTLTGSLSAPTPTIISTASLIAAGSPSGTYTINDVDTYFDASTGYALYSSFGTNGTYTAASYPAYNGNEIKYSELSTYGYSSPAPSYSDGTTAVNFSIYTAKNGYFAFYNSGSNTTNMDLTTWNGPSNVTDLRVVWGNGDVSNTGTDGILYINNTSIRGSMSGEHTDTSSFNPTGATPLLRVYEGVGSISGISQIWFKNG